MMSWSREQLGEAIARMVNRYGEAERQFARHPLTSPEGRLAGRAVRRRAAAIERLARALVDAPLTQPKHPTWCVPSMCTVATVPSGEHQTEPLRIRDGLFATLRQSAAGSPLIAVEEWDQPGDPEPVELVLLDVPDALLLADALNTLTDTAWGIQS
ncbi:hypothetical protein [Micromonospora sp. NPDC048839]|uniref:hypothetical protein n=1 Tax=Micromonospora sp. NPDC048839 TaxID=3155641 RepID=UPI0033C2B70E